MEKAYPPTNYLLDPDNTGVMPWDPRLKNTNVVLIDRVNSVAMVDSTIAVRAATYCIAPVTVTDRPRIRRPRRQRAVRLKQTRNPTIRGISATVLPYPQAFSLLGATSRFVMLAAMHSYSVMLTDIHPDPARAAFMKLAMSKKKPRKKKKSKAIGGTANNQVDKVVDVFAIVRPLMRAKLMHTTGINRFPGIHIPCDPPEHPEPRCTGMVKFDLKCTFPGTPTVANTLHTHAVRSQSWEPYCVPPGLDTIKYSAVKTMALVVEEVVETGMVRALVLRAASQEILAPLYQKFHVGVLPETRRQLREQHRQLVIDLTVQSVTVHSKLIKVEPLPDSVARAVANAVFDFQPQTVEKLAIAYSQPTLSKARENYSIISCIDDIGNSSNPEHMTKVIRPSTKLPRQHGRGSRTVTSLHMRQPRATYSLDLSELPAMPAYV
jgi:hypothetical protein